MARDISTDLQNLLDLTDCETQMTLDLYLADDETEFHFATKDVEFDDIVRTADLRPMGEIKQSIGASTDRVAVRVQNVDKAFGGTITDEDLVKATAIVGRLFIDPRGELPTVWDEMFRGEARPTQLDELLSENDVINDLAAAGYCVGEWSLAESCQDVYKDPDTCGYAGDMATCNKRRKSLAGCQGHIVDDMTGETNEFRFNGMEFPEAQTPGAPSGDGGGDGDPGSGGGGPGGGGGDPPGGGGGGPPVLD